MELDSLIFEDDVFAEPVRIEIDEKDEELIREIAYILYFNHRISPTRRALADDLATLYASTDGGPVKESKVHFAKYMFLKFATASFCELVLYNKETKTFTVPEIVDINNPDFIIDLNYHLRITSVFGSETVFFVMIILHGDDSVHILISGSAGKQLHSSAIIENDPRELHQSCITEYFRKLWTDFEINFYFPIFQKLRYDQILTCSSESGSGSVLV